MIQFNGQQVLDEIGRRIDESAHKIGREVVQIAERYAPKRTGRLATSISYAYDNVTHSISFIVGAPYGVFVEYGTRHSMPHPYLRPALNTVGTIYGFQTEMAFTNTIQTDHELLARGPGFIGGKRLTDRQRAHVRANLKPRSEMHHTKNVSRAKLSVHHRRREF